MSKVLVVATSRKTRGGITSVIKAYERNPIWKEYHCYWIQTHRDGYLFRKLLYLIAAWIRHLIFLPFYDINTWTYVILCAVTPVGAEEF